MIQPQARTFTMHLPLSCGKVAQVRATLPPAIVAGLEGLPGGDPDLAWYAVAEFALEARARGERATAHLND